MAGSGDLPARDIGIFMPAYQAGRHLAPTVARIPDGIWRRLDALWIIDDGSRDDTAEVSAALMRRHPEVRVHRFERNRGYGAAVAEGLARVAARPVRAAVGLHADGQYAPESIPDLLLALDRGLDLAQGSRHAAGTALAGGMPLYKWAAGRLLTAAENAVFALRLTDYHSGMIAYGRRALDRLPFPRLSGGFDFDLEAIACARAAGLRIGEVPIPTRYADEVSHLRPVAYGFRCLRVLGRFLAGRYARMVRARAPGHPPSAPPNEVFA